VVAGAGGPAAVAGPWSSETWAKGYLFSRALTIGGGTAEVQRNIIAERVLGLPHDVDVDAGRSWADAHRAAGAPPAP